MLHEIKNQYDNHIIDEDIRGEINYALEHDMEYTYFEDTRVDIVSSKTVGNEKVTIVKVGGI